MEPAVHAAGHSAYFVQEDSVDPLLLMRAALAAARNLGVEIRGHTEAEEIRRHDNGVEVVTQADTFSTAAAVDCRGAWSGAPVRPRKGQMLYVYPETSILQHVLRAPEVYIVPRSSGKILIGATVEDVGFDKSVSASTIRELQNAAAKYVPALASAPITQSWAGLRPGTPDDLPILGPTRYSWRIRCHRPLSKWHPSCPNNGTNHGRSYPGPPLSSRYPCLLSGPLLDHAEVSPQL